MEKSANTKIGSVLTKWLAHAAFCTKFYDSCDELGSILAVKFHKHEGPSRLLMAYEGGLTRLFAHAIRPSRLCANPTVELKQLGMRREDEDSTIPWIVHEGGLRKLPA